MKNVAFNLAYNQRKILAVFFVTNEFKQSVYSNEQKKRRNNRQVSNFFLLLFNFCPIFQFNLPTLLDFFFFFLF